MSSGLSPLEKMALLPADVRAEIWETQARKHGLTVEALKAQMATSWRFLARPKQLAPPGDWVFWFVMAGRGFGKALGLDTPLPTPTGWTTMRDVQVGDELLDERGRPTTVVDTSPVYYDHDCYRVRFDDGTEVIADAGHRWPTTAHRERKQAFRRDRQATPREPRVEIRTTAEIAATLTHSSRADRNHAVPVASPLDLPPRDLPIDPYVLGLWLGDGSSYGAEVTIGEQDRDAVLDLIAERGETAKRKTGTIEWRIGGGRPRRRDTLQARLRVAGLLRNKHIPAEYLRASEQQRRSLLAGLLDSDGHATSRNTAEFYSTNERLAEGAYELIASLGYKPRLWSKPAKLYGRACGTVWSINFRPDRPVFGLARKNERIDLSSSDARAGVRKRRMVVACDRIPCVPVKCVTVGSPSHLFLATRAMIPTHNTLTGAQFVRERGLERKCRIALIAPTLGDVRATMVEGETGLLSVLPNDALMGQSREIAWNKSLLQLTLANGTIMQGFSSETPDRLRGPQHHYVWGEEVSSWRDAAKGAAVGSEQNTTWSNMILGLRLGDHPRAVLTSTPKANRLTRDLVKMPALTLVRGSSYENRANLSDVWWNTVVAPLAGTRTGRQEIEAELLEDVEGALWTVGMIDVLRVLPPAPALRRIVVAVDPNTTSGEAADDAGVIVCGIGHSPDGKGNRHGYVLDDRTTTRGGPAAWAVAAVNAYHDWEADRIVAEKNQGGEMVALTIKGVDPTVPVKLVNASRGKRTRAEPVAALYSPLEGIRETGLIHHVGAFPELEDEMTTWTGEGESPNRMDALVWGMTELKLWTPVSQHRGGLARGRLPGTTMGDGLGDLATHRV